MKVHVGRVSASPGALWLAGTRHGLLRVGFGTPPRPLAGTIVSVVATPGPLRAVTASVRAYFRGEIPAPEAKLDLAPRAPFTEKVLAAVSRIAPGDTRSFEDVATEVGDRAAARAVGRVLARNPLPIFIPCHRVVTKQGELSGYIGGARWKQFLLDLETGQLHLTKRKRRSRARRD